MTDQTNGDEWLPGLTDPVEVGRGGFGVVYRAVETDLNRTVAVKILSGALDDLARQRFDRERRAMGALSGHPNIVAIHRTGLTVENRPYLVMEYLTEGSMGERLDALGQLPWRDTVDIGVRLCAALATAHQAGVLHRDVKPENVFLSALGTPKLGDFGIARLEGAPQTQSAVITGSLAHAAPELIDGKAPSVQSDIYGLASTLITLVVGKPPFVRDTDDSIVSMLARIVTEPLPDLRDQGIPDAVVGALEQAMAKDPAERFATVAEFGRALQQAQRETNSPVTPLEVQGIPPTEPHGVGAPAAPEIADPEGSNEASRPVPPVPAEPGRPTQPDPPPPTTAPTAPPATPPTTPRAAPPAAPPSTPHPGPPPQPGPPQPGPPQPGPAAQPGPPHPGPPHPGQQPNPYPGGEVAIVKKPDGKMMAAGVMSIVAASLGILMSFWLFSITSSEVGGWADDSTEGSIAAVALFSLAISGAWLYVGIATCKAKDWARITVLVVNAILGGLTLIGAFSNPETAGGSVIPLAWFGAIIYLAATGKARAPQ